MEAFVGVLAFIGGSAILLVVFVAIHGFVEFLRHTREIADNAVKKCCSLESMLFDNSRRVDSLAREVHLLKATDNHKESS